MKGIWQQYDLGKYLRQRYDGFFPRKYVASEIAVRSSSYNRAIMSALTTMAGLFEPEGDQIWNKNVNWQPVSVQVIPKADDPLLYTSRSCPAAEKLWEDYKKNSLELRRVEQQYSTLLKYLEEKSGFNRSLSLYKDVVRIFDSLNCEHDTTLSALFNNLGAPQNRNPPYAAMLMIELHQVGDQYFVEVYYRNDSAHAAHIINVGECPGPCSLHQFGIRSDSRIPKNWYKECGFDDCSNKHTESGDNS
uniref:acid phosphatase n=1 Tax=Plectus sambesii TaxID=2011161 RepID=A0A914VHV5_9BILA